MDIKYLLYNKRKRNGVSLGAVQYLQVHASFLRAAIKIRASQHEIHKLYTNVAERKLGEPRIARISAAWSILWR